MSGLRGRHTFQSLFAETAITPMDVPPRKGRSEERIKQRNDKFVHRIVWYRLYHKDLNYEAVLDRLEEEIDLAKFTIGKMTIEFATEIRQLMLQNPTRDYFKKKFPYLVW